MLTAFATVPPLNWMIFVEVPISEAYSALYASIFQSGLFLISALALAVAAGVFLAQRMLVPIKQLQVGAARIGAGDLSQRITINTGDELEDLGHQFNFAASQLANSYATLERKVEERTQDLARADLAKSRFLAVASHDLRQPLHALGLFVAQLQANLHSSDQGRIVDKIAAAVGAMNELFTALLDISKLDAGALVPNVAVFPILELLRRVEITFDGAARERGLSLRIVPSSVWVCSDMILLDRILMNLVSNAVRCTTRGGIVVGCRRRGAMIYVEVWDSGIGIPPDQHEKIFTEFYRSHELDGDQRGLDLASPLWTGFAACSVIPSS